MKLYLFALLLLLSPFSMADSQLTKADIEAYVGVMQGFNQLADKYPDEVAKMEAKVQEFTITDGGQSWANSIDQAPFKGEITSVLAANGYASVEQFTAQASRIMVALFAVQMDDNEAAMKVAVQASQGYAEKLRAQGLSEEMIAQVEQGMAQAKHSMVEAEKAQKMATAADKAFIRANADWIEGKMDLVHADDDRYPEDVEYGDDDQ